MIRGMKTILPIIALLSASWLSALQADELRLASVFSDHMVLQRQMPVRVWGHAAAGVTVQVSFAGQQQRATAGADGAWQVVLEPLQAESGGQELTVQAGDQQVVIRDVLVGEVWLLGGQSNMEMPLWWRGDSDGMKNAEGTRLVLGTDHPWLRVMTVPQRATRTVQEDFVPGERDGDGVVAGRWFAAQSRHEAISGFSALGYFLGVQLHEKLGVPIGLIDTSWGGTIAAAWNSQESLAGIPEAAGMVSRKAGLADAWSAEGVQAARAGNGRVGAFVG